MIIKDIHAFIYIYGALTMRFLIFLTSSGMSKSESVSRISIHFYKVFFFSKTIPKINMKQLLKSESVILDKSRF